MRFVVPDTKRIELKDGPDGEKNWIEIKKELTKGEDATFRTKAFSTHVNTGNTALVQIDWEKLAFARVESYLVDWSAKREDGKDLPITPDSLRAMAPEDFDEIDQAIQAHIAELDKEKKRPSGVKSPETTLPS